MHKVIRHVLRRWRMENSITFRKLAKQTWNEIWVRTCVSVPCHPSYIRLHHVYFISIMVVTNSNECMSVIFESFHPSHPRKSNKRVERTLNSKHTHDMLYVLIYNLKTQQWSEEASICLNETQYDTRAQIFRTPVS